MKTKIFTGLVLGALLFGGETVVAGDDSGDAQQHASHRKHHSAATANNDSTGSRPSVAFSGSTYNAGTRRYGGSGTGTVYPYYYGSEYPGLPANANAASVTARVQSDLSDLGFYVGQYNGVMGPGTVAAIIAYQRAYGLPVTGAIDGSLLYSLSGR